jgi:hypothetical protein
MTRIVWSKGCVYLGLCVQCNLSSRLGLLHLHQIQDAFPQYYNELVLVEERLIVEHGHDGVYVRVYVTVAGIT